jgi:hypothetical protein
LYFVQFGGSTVTRKLSVSLCIFVRRFSNWNESLTTLLRESVRAAFRFATQINDHLRTTKSKMYDECLLVTSWTSLKNRSRYWHRIQGAQARTRYRLLWWRLHRTSSSICSRKEVVNSSLESYPNLEIQVQYYRNRSERVGLSSFCLNWLTKWQLEQRA